MGYRVRLFGETRGENGLKKRFVLDSNAEPSADFYGKPMANAICMARKSTQKRTLFIVKVQNVVQKPASSLGEMPPYHIKFHKRLSVVIT